MRTGSSSVDSRIAHSQRYPDPVATEKPRPTAVGLREAGKQHADSRGPEAGMPDRRDLQKTPPTRRAAVEETAGALTGAYEPGDVAALREDWPA